jgi:hypothetical protein
MNVEQLVKDLRLGIIKKQQEISDAQDIIAKLTQPEKRSVNNTSILAIGDSPRSSVTAYCQANGKGMPVDFSQRAPKEGYQWALQFTSDAVTYISYGSEIPGGVAMTLIEASVHEAALAAYEVARD